MQSLIHLQCNNFHDFASCKNHVTLCANKRNNRASNVRNDMRKLVLSILIACALLPARAQFFSPEASGGALVGALAGGIFGGRHPGRAIAIGAASGLFLGSIAHAANQESYGYSYYSGYPYYGCGTYAYRQPYAYNYYAPFYTSYSYAAPSYASYAPAAVSPPPPQPQPPTSTSPSYRPGSSMSAANALFGR